MGASRTHVARRRAERRLAREHPELFDRIHQEERVKVGLPADPRGPAACGTRSGLQAHRRRGEDPCETCREAERAYQRQRRAAQVVRGVVA